MTAQGLNTSSPALPTYLPRTGSEDRGWTVVGRCSVVSLLSVALSWSWQLALALPASALDLPAPFFTWDLSVSYSFVNNTFSHSL